MKKNIARLSLVALIVSFIVAPTVLNYYKTGVLDWNYALIMCGAFLLSAILTALIVWIADTLK